MAVAELLTEITKPDYAGLSDKEILQILNELHYENQPCLCGAIGALFDRISKQSTSILARVEAINSKLTKEQFLAWMGVQIAIKDHADQVFDFSIGNPSFNDLLIVLRDLGAITLQEFTDIESLGLRFWHVRDTVYQTLVTQEILDAARNLQPLTEKLITQKQLIQDEFYAKNAQVAELHAEVQKLDPVTLVPIGDPAFVPAWEAKP